MKRKTAPAIPQPVDFGNNDHDLECAILGEAGWHTSAIARETNLTESQVQYRLGRAGVKRKDYRDGRSEMANFMLTQIRSRSNAKKRIAAANQLPHEIDALQEKFVDNLEAFRHRQMVDR
jgi:hypothetical protein